MPAEHKSNVGAKLRDLAHNPCAGTGQAAVALKGAVGDNYPDAVHVAAQHLHRLLIAVIVRVPIQRYQYEIPAAR